MLQIGGDLPAETQAVRFAWLSKDISTKAELLSAIAAELDFPEYFGGNWDALWDCLADLSWIPELTIVVAHERAPRLEPEELATYLGLLQSAAEIKRRKANCDLLAWFPETDREVLEAALLLGEAH